MATQADVNAGVIQPATTTSQVDSEKTAKEMNFEKLRRKLEAQEQAIAERDAVLRQQQETLSQLQSRLLPQDRDEFDSLPDDELLDKAKFKRALEKERQKLLKEAEEIARKTYQKIDSENFEQKLLRSYPDYHKVVTEENAQLLEQKDPEFAAILSEVGDQYKRREMAYRRIQRLRSEQKEEAPVKAQDVVKENRQQAAAYYTPSGQQGYANPYGFEFDVRNPAARQQAYQRLKAAQKRG